MFATNFGCFCKINYFWLPCVQLLAHTNLGGVSEFSQENKYSWPRKHDLSWSSPWWSVYGKEDHRVKRDKIAMVKKISCFSAIDYRVVAYCLVFVFVEENLDIYKSEFYTIS